MDDLDILCRLCDHKFKEHHDGGFGVSWYCNGDNKNCPCDDFLPWFNVSEDAPTSGDDYRWN